MSGRATNEPTNYWAFGFQSAKDSEATTFTFLRHLDGTANEAQDDIESVREGGDGQYVGLRYRTGVSMDGQAVAFARPETAARLFAAVLGADAVDSVLAIATSASGLANRHTFTPAATIPYLTIEQYWADNVERVTNCQVTGLDIEFEAGRPLKITPQFVGGGTHTSRAVGSALTPTRETGAPFFYPGASVVLDGAANSKITKGKVSIRRNVDDSIRTTALNREDVVALNFDVDADLTLKYENATLYKQVHYGGGSVVPIPLATSTFKLVSILGSGTSTRWMELNLPTLDYTGARVNKLDPDGKTMYIDTAAMGIKSDSVSMVVARAIVASSAAFVS